MSQIFCGAYLMTGDRGLSILLLSAAVNTLLLPLYSLGDKIQLREQALQASLQPKLDEFRRAFSGNMLHMVQKTLYRQRGYHPIYALRGGLGFAIQVPFFIAAYHFLSHLELLQGQSWGPIIDLGQPDGLLPLPADLSGPAGRGNLLPVLMTALNLLSGLAYSAQNPYGSTAAGRQFRRQLWGIAILFLILLYPAPAALLLYWSFSNLYSLGKNLISASRKQGRDYWQRIARRGCAIGHQFFTALLKIRWLPLLEYGLAVLGFFLLARFKVLDSVDAQAQKALYWGRICWYAFAFVQILRPLGSLCPPRLFPGRTGTGTEKPDDVKIPPRPFARPPAQLPTRRHSGLRRRVVIAVCQLMIVIASLCILSSSLSSNRRLAISLVIISLSPTLAFLPRLWRCRAFQLLNGIHTAKSHTKGPRKTPDKKPLKLMPGGATTQLAAASTAALCGLGLFNSSALLASSPSESPQAIAVLLRYIFPGFGICAIVLVLFIFIPSFLPYSMPYAVLRRRWRGLNLQLAYFGSGALLLALFDNFVMRHNYGVMTSWVFDQPERLIIPFGTIWLCLASLPLLYLLWLFLLRRLQVLVPLCWILAASLWLSSAHYAYNLRQFQRDAQTLPASQVSPAAQTDASQNSRQLQSVFSYSSDQPNVIILMLDRFIGPYLADILQLDPELRASLDGFTWYKNTLSPGPYTISGLTALLGGHEYSPDGIARLEGSLKEKINQAYLLLPTLFRQNGFESTVADPSWANFDWKGDLELFRRNGIRAERLKGRYTGQWLRRSQESRAALSASRTEPAGQTNQETQETQLGGAQGQGPQPKYAAIMLLQAVFRALPAPLAPLIYDNGSWLGNNFAAGNMFLDLVNAWAGLVELPQISDAQATKPQFVFMTNDTPHEPMLMGYRAGDPRFPFQPMLQTEVPGPSNSPLPPELLRELLGPNNSDYSLRHFYADWATLKELRHYFKWMRQNGVYDNSLIILISDHGRDVRLPSMDLGPKESNYAYFMPLLMVKLPHAQGPVQSDLSPHSSADVPYFASLVLPPEQRRNPFTGKALEQQNPQDPRHAYYIDSNPASQKADRFNKERSYRITGPLWETASWQEIR